MGTKVLTVYQATQKVIYTNLLASGKLNNYLATINWQAENVLFREVKQFDKKEDVTEKRQTENQME
ncbi:MAG: TnpV protein [Candidatus Fimenecus sp.]